VFAIVAAAAEQVLRGKAVAEPGARDEIGRGLFVGLEIAFESEQDEDVLLRVAWMLPRLGASWSAGVLAAAAGAGSLKRVLARRRNITLHDFRAARAREVPPTLAGAWRVDR
jgi:hypothetical protein